MTLNGLECPIQLKVRLVDDTLRKFACGFLLVRHCDYGPILHRF